MNINNFFSPDTAVIHVDCSFGVHFFGMLQWIFDSMMNSTIYIKTIDTTSGILFFKQAKVNWHWSINLKNLPQQSNDKGLSIYRVLTIELEEIQFRYGFTDFHKVSYNEPLVGKGYGLVYAMSSTEKVNEIKKL